MHDVRGAARAMSISRASVFALIARGELSSTVVAGRRLIAHADLVDLVRRKHERGAEGPTPSTPHMRSADAGGSPH
jgi:hypothetical protein